MRKNQIRNLIVVMISLSLFGVGFSANFLPISPLSTQYTCSQKSKMYLGEDSDKNGLGDYRLYLRNNFRLVLDPPLPTYNAGQIYQYDDASNANNTKVFYYAAESDMLKKWDVTNSGFYPLDNATFKRASWVFPYNQRVRGIDTNNTRVLFRQPSNPSSSNVVSFVYSYKYAYALGYQNGTSPYWYNFVSSGLDFHGLNTSDYVDWTSQKRSWSAIKTLDNCKNYELYRCGDGTTNTYVTGAWVDSFTGETCDDGALNGTAGKCDINCGRGGAGGYCGDGIMQADLGEECDEGVNNGTDLCTKECANPVQDVAVDEAVNE